jgi:hypothetical protein
MLFFLAPCVYVGKFTFQHLNGGNPTTLGAQCDTQALHCCYEPLLARQQWACFFTMTTTADGVAMCSFLDNDRCQCHITQHHQPVCEPLLIGGSGGSDNKGQGQHRLQITYIRDNKHQGQ